MAHDERDFLGDPADPDSWLNTLRRLAERGDPERGIAPRAFTLHGEKLERLRADLAAVQARFVRGRMGGAVTAPAEGALGGLEGPMPRQAPGQPLRRRRA